MTINARLIKEGIGLGFKFHFPVKLVETSKDSPLRNKWFMALSIELLIIHIYISSL